jgi:hypothetical protein
MAKIRMKSSTPRIRDGVQTVEVRVRILLKRAGEKFTQWLQCIIQFSHV